jgi:hypothetical protein
MAKTEQDQKSKYKEDRKSKNERRFLQAIRHLRPNLEAASLDPRVRFLDEGRQSEG